MQTQPRRRIGVGAIAVVLALAAPATAQAASPEVQHAEGVAATLPAAANVQAAEANQAALAPSVKAVINAGDGLELLESTSNPDVLGALLRSNVQISATAGQGGYHVAVGPPKGARIARRARAHAAGCWGWIADQVTFNVAGGTIGWIYVRNNGWCGNGYAITWYGGPTYAAWSWGPYCWTSKGSDYSWDGWPTWIHTAHWGEFGVSYPWGCAGIRGGKAVVRFAANGYWDRYNDYGF